MALKRATSIPDIKAEALIKKQKKKKRPEAFALIEDLNVAREWARPID